MQVPRDPVAVGHQRELLAVRDRLGPVQGQRRLVCERGQQLDLLDLQARPTTFERHEQHTALRDLRPQRHQHDGAVLRVRYDGHLLLLLGVGDLGRQVRDDVRDPGDVSTVGRHDLRRRRHVASSSATAAARTTFRAPTVIWRNASSVSMGGCRASVICTDASSHWRRRSLWA